MTGGTAVAETGCMHRVKWASDLLMGSLFVLLVTRASCGFVEERIMPLVRLCAFRPLGGGPWEPLAQEPPAATTQRRAWETAFEITPGGWRLTRPLGPPEPRFARELSPGVYEVHGAPEDLNVGCSRIVPAFRDGVAVGFKLLGVRPGSFADQLGVKNGDTLLRVNGIPLRSPESALEIHAQLKRALRFVIDLERDGLRLRKVVLVTPPRAASPSRPSTSTPVR